MSVEGNSKIKLSMQKVLQSNKVNVDKYLDMRYNIGIQKLVNGDDDKVRGELQFINELRKLMNTTTK